MFGRWLVDAIGRRSSLRWAGAPAIVGWLMVLVGPGFNGWSGAAQIGRVLTGVGAGVTAVAAPLLVVSTCG
jgi:hypothetical protein